VASEPSAAALSIGKLGDGGYDTRFDVLHAAGAGELMAIPAAQTCLETFFLDLYCATAVLKLSQRSSPMYHKKRNDEDPEGDFWKSCKVRTAAGLLFGERAGAGMSSSSKPPKGICARDYEGKGTESCTWIATLRLLGRNEDGVKDLGFIGSWGRE
jgi:hypothetical protein